MNHMLEERAFLMAHSGGGSGTHCGKGTKPYLGVLEQKLYAVRGKNTNPINPMAEVKAHCSLGNRTKEGKPCVSAETVVIPWS